MLNSSDPILQSYRRPQLSVMTAAELAEKILGDEGLYVQLEKRWEVYKAYNAWNERDFAHVSAGAEPTFVDDDGITKTGDKALLPGPTVDKTLSELVELCIGTYKEGMVAEFFDLVEKNPKYKARMAELPGLTGSAEGEMEKFYAKKALERIVEPVPGNGHGIFSQHGIKDICSRAERKLEEYLARNNIPFNWGKDKDGNDTISPVYADKKEVVEQSRRILRLAEAISPFPYTHNYEHIAYGEKHLLTNPYVHQNFPASLLHANQQRLIADKTGKEAQEVKDQNPEAFGFSNMPEKYMTFVGSGALPLTGLMNHIITGCKINLVDSDHEAAEISRTLISYLEGLNVLATKAVTVYESDGADVHYVGPRDRRQNHIGKKKDEDHYYLNDDGSVPRDEHGKPKCVKRLKAYVPTDVLYIAGLIPNKSKRLMMHNVTEDKTDPVPCIMVRSARGLSRMLYEPIEESVFSENLYYHPHGTLVPERHVLPEKKLGKDAGVHYDLTAYKEDAISPRCISAMLSDDNVNTAELLFRSELPLVNPSIEFEEGSKFAQQVEKELGRKPDFSHIERQKIRDELERAKAQRPTPPSM